MNRRLKNFYWNLPFISDSEKEKFFYWVKGILRAEKGHSIMSDSAFEILDAYRKQILAISVDRDEAQFKSITEIAYNRVKQDPKIIAYYLPQMHPTPDNDRWWGKGITEWNNVSKAVPQYLGHYQPRLPGELGYYDLRIKDNIVRQTELARMYGIYAFCWYYYWFDGKRLLDLPLNLYRDNPDIDFPFCLCWANEDWTKSFSGSSREVLVKQSRDKKSYVKFIHGITPYLEDKRYITINGKKLLIIYKPMDIPESQEVTDYWREYCKNKGIGELYLVGCWTSDLGKYSVLPGFDAMAEFQPGSILNYCKKKNDQIQFINEHYFGAVYGYDEIIHQKVYARNFNKGKLYNAIMPMWDNTPRRNNRGSMIFDASSPDLYKIWLKEIIQNNHSRNDLDDDLIFVNAWNEWGEGAYLEPDRRYGYAYLQATLDAILESREMR